MPATTISFSMTPILFAVQLLAILFAARAATSQKEMQSSGWIKLLLFVLVIWGGVSVWLALRGTYLSAPLLASYPMFWLPFIPVALVITPLALFAKARDQMRGLIDATPARWLICVHALRILAIGTLIKAWMGEFSLSFATWVGIPDLLFGLSAILMLWLAVKDRVSDLGLLVWNILGFLVIIPGAIIVGQRGLPGIFHAIEETPSITTLFEFPMVLAPTLVVPLFVMINLFVAIRLIERMSWRTSSFEEKASPSS